MVDWEELTPMSPTKPAPSISRSLKAAAGWTGYWAGGRTAGGTGDTVGDDAEPVELGHVVPAVRSEEQRAVHRRLRYLPPAPPALLRHVPAAAWLGRAAAHL